MRAVWGIAFSALVTTVAGTLAHRMGAVSNLPIGLLLGFALVCLSAWLARVRRATTGLVVHVVVSSLVLWLFSLPGFGGNAIFVAGYAVPMPWLTTAASSVWLFGAPVAQALLALLPARWVEWTRQPFGAAEDSADKTVENAELRDIDSKIASNAASDVASDVASNAASNATSGAASTAGAPLTQSWSPDAPPSPAHD